MSEAMLSIIKVIIAAVFGLTLVCAGKHHRSQPETYDQKQTGDYNIRIHLKDFQIVALLNDGLGDVGDYDYNYDYSDLTVKPLLPSTTTSFPTKPPTTSTPKTSPSESTSETLSTSLASASPSPTTSEAPETTPKDSDIIFLNNQTNIDNETLIAVQVLYDAFNLKKLQPGSASVNEIPNPTTDKSPVEDTFLMEETEPSKQKKRRCAHGFRRDQKGRCRVLRRPTLPFEAQLSKLASRLRQGNPPQTA